MAPEFAESIKSALQSLSHRLKVLEDEALQREVELAEKDMEQTDFQASTVLYMLGPLPVNVHYPLTRSMSMPITSEHVR